MYNYIETKIIIIINDDHIINCVNTDLLVCVFVFIVFFISINNKLKVITNDVISDQHLVTFYLIVY